MNKIMLILLKGGFTIADAAHYKQTAAGEYAAYALKDDWTYNDINYEDCEAVALDRLADYAYNYNSIKPMKKHLTAYCGRCTDEQAQSVIKAIKKRMEKGRDLDNAAYSGTARV